MTSGSRTERGGQTTAGPRGRTRPGVLRRRTFLAGVTALVLSPNLNLPAAAQTRSGYGCGYTGGY